MLSIALSKARSRHTIAQHEDGQMGVFLTAEDERPAGLRHRRETAMFGLTAAVLARLPSSDALHPL